MRRAIAADAPALSLVHAAAFDTPWSARSLAGFMSDAGAITFLDEEPPQGFILIRAMAGEAEILTLAVDPSARRKGIARTLVEAAALAAREAGAVSLFLEVAADNFAALSLYQGCGFGEVGRRAGYYRRGEGPGMDALVLKRDLTANASQHAPDA